MKITILFTLQFFIVSIVCVFAQSGRTVPSPTPIAEPVDIVETKENKKTYPPCEKSDSDFIYVSPRKIREFTEELNRYGSCGYRLEKSAKIPLKMETSETNTYFFGVMKLDLPNKFEYQWFEAYTHGSAQTRMNFRAKEGFYFRASHLFQILDDTPEETAADKINSIHRSTFGAFFIFERKNNERKKHEYRITNGNNGARDRLREQNQNALNQLVIQGFRPVGMTYEDYEFGIVMEKDEQIRPNGEYLIINKYKGVDKEFGKLATLGYEPIFSASNFALLRKSEQTQIPVSYKSIYYPEDLLKNLSKWSRAYYQLSSFSPTGAFAADLHTELKFVILENDKIDHYEYILHKMTDVREQPAKESNYENLRALPTAEALDEFHSLLKKGFIIREILASKEIYILFERRKK